MKTIYEKLSDLRDRVQQAPIASSKESTILADEILTLASIVGDLARATAEGDAVLFNRISEHRTGEPKV